MKKLILILGLGLMTGMVNINRMEAQVHVSINIDIQPAWGPSGYNYAEFYYIPELNIYYDVTNRLFCYRNGGRWISAPYLPVMYSHYDFYSLYKIVLNDIRYPWKYNNRHRRMYAKYRRNYVQVPIFYMNDTRYHRARDNYYVWVEPHHMPGNNGRPSGRDFSKNTRNGRIGSDVRSSVNDGRENSRSVRKESSRSATRSTATARSDDNTRSRSAVDRKSPVDDARTDKDNSSVSERSEKEQNNKKTTSVRSSTRSRENKSSRSESADKTTRRSNRE